MKKLFILFVLPLIFSCSKDDTQKEPEILPVTPNFLSEGTGCWLHMYDEVYIDFTSSTVKIFNPEDKTYGYSYYDYTISGDVITFVYIDKYFGDNQTYTGKIDYVIWNNEDGEQLRITGSNLPPNVKSGYYDKQYSVDLTL